MPDPQHNIGITGSVDEKLGLVALTVPYVSPDNLQTDAELIAWCVTVVPDPLPVSGVPLVSRKFSQMPSGAYKLELTFDGSQDPDNAEGEDFSLEGTLSEDRIETHPRITQLIEDYQAKKLPDGHYFFPPTLFTEDPNSVAIGVGERTRSPMSGTDSY